VAVVCVPKVRSGLGEKRSSLDFGSFLYATPCGFAGGLLQRLVVSGDRFRCRIYSWGDLGPLLRHLSIDRPLLPQPSSCGLGPANSELARTDGLILATVHPENIELVYRYFDTISLKLAWVKGFGR
jgi:hypothetical protein